MLLILNVFYGLKILEFKQIHSTIWKILKLCLLLNNLPVHNEKFMYTTM